MIEPGGGKSVPPGQTGELVCRGPYTIRGYYDDPDANARSFTADGFYRMGGLVRKVGRYVYTEGRKKDVINRGGEKISSEEIEDLILAHDKHVVLHIAGGDAGVASDAEIEVDHHAPGVLSARHAVIPIRIECC